jgi:uncharacterized protein (UPF0276 family)
MADARIAGADADPIPAAAGIGLRFQHHREVLAERPGIAWLEVHAENYMGGGAALAQLVAIRRDYPISLHGVGLSLGSAEGIDRKHLERLARLADHIRPGLISEHLAWSVDDGTYLGDLLPLPLTEESLEVVGRNVNIVQERLAKSILVENPSSYIRYRHSTIPEWEFLTALAERTGCGILCDINNVYVVACNHGYDARRYIEALPCASTGELHLAGHAVRDLGDGRTIRIDDHGRPVQPEVWTLYAAAVARFGALPTLIEWDSDIPPLAVLLEEAAKAQRVLDGAGERRDAHPA